MKNQADAHDAASQLREFFGRYPSVTLKEGDNLLQPGDNLSSVYYLEQGFIRQYVVSTDGVELTHHLYKPGSFFPLLLSLHTIENRFYIDSFTETVLRPAPVAEVVSYLKENPDVLIDLNMRLLAGLNGLLHRIESMTFGSATTRIANSLLYMAKHFGHEEQGLMVITQPFTHKNLSHIAGLTRETTSLELEKLVQKKVIGRNQYSYTILDRTQLERLAEF